jgi:hypothetical protein
MVSAARERVHRAQDVGMEGSIRTRLAVFMDDHPVAVARK